ncbi:MAG: hypothetical protein GY833_23970 [Aestuariibacter sp.]|nr:hypothetical protein [Aestuariibacter sp.]
MSKTGISTNMVELDGYLVEHLKDYGVGAQFAGRDTMRAFVNNLVGMTFPERLKEGKMAIDADTDKIFASLDSQEALGFFNSEFGEGTYTKGGKLKGKKRQSKANRRIGNTKFNWSGDQALMRQYHQDHRNSKGKVNRRVGEHQVGPWKFMNGMYVTKTAMRKYRRELYSHIGKVKAGWANAAIYFARVTNGRLVMPAFVRKQPDRRSTFTDNFTDDGNGFATATNNIPYASRLTKFFMQSAVLRTNQYGQRVTEKQTEKIVERFNALKGGTLKVS